MSHVLGLTASAALDGPHRLIRNHCFLQFLWTQTTFHAVGSIIFFPHCPYPRCSAFPQYKQWGAALPHAPRALCDSRFRQSRHQIKCGVRCARARRNAQTSRAAAPRCISRFNAPRFSQYIFCAPTFIFCALPSASITAIAVKGGTITASS